ncbi:MBL fold metallo-hydrolase [Streptomyces sp. NPDC101194]|uniref:MBL fold metallo-hydrolase n=1 Tax=Streptomyces sp. NPDC101194 TaxID=3366127 RepID=UPI00382F30C3
MVDAYLLLGRHPVIVDAGTPGSGQLIYDRVVAHGVDPKDVRLVVVTHGPVDHFGSAAELSRLTGAPIAGHIADLGIYRAGGVSEPYLPIGLFGRLFVRTSRARETTEPFEPNVLIRGETRSADFGIEARIMPTPGHTAGSVSVLTDTGDLVAGDLVAIRCWASSRGVPAIRPSTTIGSATWRACAKCWPSAPPSSTSATARLSTPNG